MRRNYEYQIWPRTKSKGHSFIDPALKNKGRQKAAQFNLVLGREEYGRGASVSLRDHPNLVRFRAVL